ncbi:MAG: hypothetical protein K6F49_12930 [Saccharofermentans sp.]|nr:hypothetical protein [Saccharofermentans sp.]
MGKRILGDSLNGLRIVLFWILMGFVAIGVSSAYKEMHVDVTVADGIVGESIVAGSYSTEYSCIVNGSEVKLHDTASHVPGDKVLVVVRDGNPYAIVSSDKVDSYTSMPSRIMRAINYDLKGDHVFVLIPYILLLFVTLRSRREFRKTYPVLIVVTHIFGLIFAWLFYITAFWVYVAVPVIYGVIFSVVWIVRILMRAKRS